MLTYLKKHTVNAVISGFCASCSSGFGKLSSMYDTTTGVSVVMKILFFMLMILFNAAVWAYFVKALRSCQSSLPPTVTSAATNYICSAVLGYLLFGEIVTFLWWSGTLLTLTGLILIAYSQNESSHSEKHK